MTGNVDDAENDGGGCVAGIAQLEMRETEVDGDAARLLFGKAVGIGAGERFDQRAFAVVHVAGGGEDEMAWHGHAVDSTAAGRGADGGDHFGVLAAENRAQVEFYCASGDVTDDREGLVAQARSKFLGGIELWMRSSVTDGIDERGKVPPPIWAWPLPTTARSGRPSSASRILSARERSSFVVARSISSTGICWVAAHINVCGGFESGENQLVAAQRAEEGIALERV